MRCPCGSGETYAECCEPLHQGTRAAATAEALMRSRFSAFAVGDAAYLLETWHPRTRPTGLALDPERRWTRLEIVSARGGPFDRDGMVEFCAHYLAGGRAGEQREVSTFTREAGAWFYVDGVSRGRTR